MKENILFLIDSSETGGAETIFLEIVSRIDTGRFVPHVAVLYDGWLYRELVKRGITPCVLPNRKGGFDFRLLVGIVSYLRRHRIDLVNAHLFTASVYATVAGTMCGVPVVSTFHGTMDVDAEDPGKRLKWWVLNTFSARVVYVSSFLRDFYVKNASASRQNAEVIRNGICIDGFRGSMSKCEARSRLTIEEGALVVGCVGDLRPAKDYGSAIRAAALLRKRFDNLHLVIAGSVTDLLEGLRDLATSLGIADRVHFIGHHPHIQEVLPAFDVYLSSSTSEGFSLSIVEAMAAGVPVVATRSGGPEEIVVDGKTGLLVEVASPEKIAEAAAAILLDAALASSLKREAYVDVSRRFSIDHMIERYSDLFWRLAGNAAAPEAA
ncbi:glycosyltransferase [Geomonas edaphica]|uniref:glycosyltransferase n=1 Tax=Geomonas edaphica TaxID=2570226 RepID=UPI0010A78337|nr:glycosyltransferase [Geomonas edaphica]